MLMSGQGTRGRGREGFGVYMCSVACLKAHGCQLLWMGKRAIEIASCGTWERGVAVWGFGLWALGKCEIGYLGLSEWVDDEW